MGDVQTDVVQTVNLHFLIDGTSHNVTGSQRQALVVLLHEGLAVGQLQDAAVAAHGLGDEVGGVCLVGIVQHRGVELYEFHVCHGTLGTINHGDAVACGNDGVGGGHIYCSAAAGTHHGAFGEIGVNFFLRIQHIGSIALDVGRAAGDTNAQVVLGDDFHGEVVLLDLDVGARPDGLHQSALYLCSGVVGMVQDAELGVSALTVQVEGTIVLAVEVDAPLHQLLYLFGSHAHHLLYGLAVADVVAGNERVGDMLVEIVKFQISH